MERECYLYNPNLNSSYMIDEQFCPQDLWKDTGNALCMYTRAQWIWAIFTTLFSFKSPKVSKIQLFLKVKSLCILKFKFN